MSVVDGQDEAPERERRLDVLRRVGLETRRAVATELHPVEDLAGDLADPCARW
jgi:hypothetical protein